MPHLTGLPAPLHLPEHPVRVVADVTGGLPCRRCLTDAAPGETVLLVPYDPFLIETPYRGAGPVYVHERDCLPHRGQGVPAQQRSRLLSCRAYDGDGMMTGAEVLEGTVLEAHLEAVFADPAVAFVHLHNARPGCFAARVDRD